MKYKTVVENFEDTLAEARLLDACAIQEILKDRLAYHGWAVRAYEQVLIEKGAA